MSTPKSSQVPLHTTPSLSSRSGAPIAPKGSHPPQASPPELLLIHQDHMLDNNISAHDSSERSGPAAESSHRMPPQSSVQHSIHGAPAKIPLGQMASIIQRMNTIAEQEAAVTAGRSGSSTASASNTASTSAAGIMLPSHIIMGGSGASAGVAARLNGAASASAGPVSSSKRDTDPPAPPPSSKALLSSTLAQPPPVAASGNSANAPPPAAASSSPSITLTPADVVEPGHEHTGRWTAEEHEAFLTALRKYGKEWKKVAARVRTRTVVQTRTHAQKYFQKLQRAMAGGGGATKERGGGSGGGGESVESMAAAFALGGEEGVVGLSGTKSSGAGEGKKGRGKSSSAGEAKAAAMAAATAGGSSSAAGGIPVSLLAGARQSDLMTKGVGSAAENSMGLPKLGLTNLMRTAAPTKRKGGMALDILVSSNQNHSATAGSFLVATTSSSSTSNRQRSSAHTSISTVGGFLAPSASSKPTIDTTHSSTILSPSNTMRRFQNVGNFPMPSPAACGKRKYAELDVAQMLAAGVGSNAKTAHRNESDGQGSTGPVGNSGGSAFLSARTSIGAKGDVTPPETMDSHMDGAATPPNNDEPSQRSRRRRPFKDSDFLTPMSSPFKFMGSGGAGGGISLQIINPEVLGSNRSHSMNSPSTPWDGQLEALSSASNINNSPKQQKNDRQSKVPMLPAESSYNDGTCSSEEEDIYPHPLHASSGRSALHLAVQSGNIIKVQHLLATHPSKIDQVFSGGCLPSLPPALSGLNAKDFAGFNILHCAACLSKNCKEIVKAIIAAGIDVKAIDGIYGCTALHWAARVGNVDALSLLTSCYCPINFTNKFGETALHWALRAGIRSKSCVRALVEEGARINTFNKNHRRPIDLAGDGFQFLTVKCIKNAGGPSSNFVKPYEASPSNHRDRMATRTNLLVTAQQCRSLILYHPECYDHVPKSKADWENPDRIRSILSRIEDNACIDPNEVMISNDFDKATLELLARVHTAEYLTFVTNLSKDLERRGATAKGGHASIGAVPFTPQVQRQILQRAEPKKETHSDTAFSAGSLRAARRAAGAVQHAVDQVLVGRNRNAFCVVRPPGHHAGVGGLLEGSDSCGFCIFNNVAAGAMHAISDRHRSRCEKVAIIDIDVHHGNGTEDILRRSSDPQRLFFFSVHLFDDDKRSAYQFYPGTGDADDVQYNIVNVPLAPMWREREVTSAIGRTNNVRLPVAISSPSKTVNTRSNRRAQTFQPQTMSGGSETDSETGEIDTDGAGGTKSSNGTNNSTVPQTTVPACSDVPSHYLLGTGRQAYRMAITTRLLPSLRAFNPDLVLISAGFDAAKYDVGNARHGPRAQRQGMDMEPEDYAWVTKKIMEIADICCQGRVVSVLEGGYGMTRRKKAKTRSAKLAAPDNDEKDNDLLDKTMFSECAIAHLRAMIDPYEVCIDRNSKSREQFQS